MKWGRKKSLAHPSLISHVFPISWLSKFKQKKGSSERMPAITKKKGHQDLRYPSSSTAHVPYKEGRFYCGDDGSYWRLSFGEEAAKQVYVQGRNSVSYDSDADDQHRFPIPDWRSSKSEPVERARSEETWKFNDMVSHIRKTRKMQEGILLENDSSRREKVSETAEANKPRKKAINDRILEKSSQRTFEEKQTERVANGGEHMTAKSADKIAFEVQPERVIHSREDFWKSTASDLRMRQSFSFPNSNLRAIKEDCIVEAMNLEETSSFSKEEAKEEEISLQCQKLKDLKIKEVTLESDQPRKLIQKDRNCQRKRRKQTRIKAYSPRTVAKTECKIRALEDMKKAKMRRKKTPERTIGGDTTTFDSYAVVKSSFDPQKDFRDSMIEMIMEKGIERPEELEELLACYLTLNCDAHHDLIIKVFRQVWFELNQVYLGPEIQNYHCYEDEQLVT